VQEKEEVVTSRKLLPGIAVVQGVFYLLTGIWPLIDIDSFQRVTGPKTDLWLVRTVGVLVIVVGATILSAARARRLDWNITLLAVGSALGLAAIDIVYVLSGTIARIDLADAAAEIALAAAWIAGRRLA
jgi:hypothetical protein